jgi:hypothetical protein
MHKNQQVLASIERYKLDEYYNDVNEVEKYNIYTDPDCDYDNDESES